MNDLRADLELALALADAADTITTSRFRARDLRIDRKPDMTPVTDADVAVEDAARALIAEHRPDDLVVGEERGGELTGSGRCWLLDPIDGTKNFSRGVPVWGTLIALLVDGRSAVGVASAPALGRRWWAATGLGAFAGAPGSAGAPISVSGVGSIEDAYLSTTSVRYWDESLGREAYLRLRDRCWESRAFGDFWQFCLLAEGGIDIAADPGVMPWDGAPLEVIVTEAGGRFTGLDGGPWVPDADALASNGLLHDAVLEILTTTR